MIVYGVNAIAKELKCSAITVRRTIQKQSDFPVVFLAGLNTYAFDVDQCKEWWRGRCDTNGDQKFSEEALKHGEFARMLGVSNRLVLTWRNRGLASTRHTDGTVWIDLKKAQEWFKKQSDTRTQAYAQKIAKTSD
ncbi:hypothetical protein [Paenibacillus glufosinatiresistens]|uniref:hypothetical protein n=1 Tax=Paenibacillus glufosinatiresistens TaxID=3070657 RepID=UPI00286E2CC3|nr:hypothetical protein [Paenibacillus sp. YX.27]